MNDIERAIEKIQRQNKKVAFDYTNGKDVTVITLMREEAETTIKALEKQIPKKPTESINGSGLYCPACKKVWVNINNNYCHRCGQAIDWSDADER